MSFKSLNHILIDLESHAAFQGVLEFRHLSACWTQVVGATVRVHTRPVSISRGVLWVATSSSSWAQNLSFQRHGILKKLNALLPSPLEDIRFSTAQWSNDASHNNSQDAQVNQHPSFVGSESIPSVSMGSALKDPNAAFDHWAKVVQKLTQHLPVCPQCQCPTPMGELQRWGVCALCTAKEFKCENF